MYNTQGINKRNYRDPVDSFPKADHRLTIINRPECPCLDAILQESKTAEGRINSFWIQKMNVGQTLCLHNHRAFAFCEITFMHRYSSFEEMLKAEGLDKMLPWAKTLSEGIEVYNRFPGAGRVKELGAVAIGLKLIKPGC